MKEIKRWILYFILVVLLASNMHGLSTDKNEYLVGEAVIIQIDTPGDLELQTPSKVLKYKGVAAGGVNFTVEETGTHRIVLKEFGQEIDSKLINVIMRLTSIPIKQVNLKTDKSTYVSGETAVIYVIGNTSNLAMELHTPSSILKQLGGLENEINYTPREVGNYSVFLKDQIDRVLAQTSFDVLDPSKLTSPIQPSISQTDEDEENVQQVSSSSPISNNRTKKIMRLLDSRDKELPASLKLYKNNFEINTQITSIQDGEYDAEIVPIIRNLLKVRLNKLNLTNNFTLKMEKVNKEVKINSRDMLDTFSIDPSSIEFDSGTITKIATGTELWKCKDWNFSTQTCFGNWIKVRDLLPGQEYNITINSSDPGFGEILITAAVHLDQNRSFISNIYNSVREIDGIWSPIISSGEFVRVTFEKYLISDNDITVYPRTINGSPRIEIYEVNQTNLIAEFTSLSDNEYNRVLLTNLIGSQITFDLKILNGSVQFDYITDPVAPTFVNSTEATNGATQTTSLEVNVPIGVQEGDALIAVIAISENEDAGTHLTTPSGWTSVISEDAELAASDPNATVYYRFANSSEPSSYTWTNGGTTTGIVGQILAYRNVGNVGGNPISQTATLDDGGVDGCPTAPSVTTAVENEIVIYIGFMDDDEIPDPESDYYPSGTTGREATEASSGANGLDVGLGTADELRASIGSTGTRDFQNCLTAEEWAGITISLLPGSEPSTAPTNIQCNDSDNCDISVATTVEINASGSTDAENDSIVYFIEALLDNITQTKVETNTSKVGILGFNATGGTITESDGSTFHTFTSNDTFEVLVGSADVEVLIVGGGAAGGTGGTAGSGGGGAGGLVHNNSFPAVVNTYTVLIGVGGTPGTSGTTSGSGGLSSFDGITALGGGGAGPHATAGAAGGSGGGGSGYTGEAGGAGNQPGSSSGGFGNAGGTSFNGGGAPGRQGGGGGSGATGQDGQSGSGGAGGVGLEYSQFSSVGGSPAGWFAGGGGGGASTGTPAGAGGQGGGGAGGSGAVGTSGTANTGGGGGGATTTGGAGGTGIIIVRVPTTYGPESNESNTTYTTHNDISNNYGSITNITFIIQIDSYNPSGSVARGNIKPDLEIEVYNGSGFVSLGLFNLNETYTEDQLNTTDVNFSFTTTNSDILTAWETITNQDIRIRGRYIDYFNQTTIDEINYTDIWITINGKTWIEIGNHSETDTLDWNVSAVTEQNCVDLRARTSDVNGSGDLSSYFTKSSCLNISRAPSITNPVLNDSVINQSEVVRLNVTISEDLTLTTTNVTLRYPNGTSANISLTNVAGDLYILDFVNTTQIGIHNITNIIATDSLGNTNNTMYTTLTFEITASPPAIFDLLTPLNQTESSNLLPNMTWEQSSDEDFLNYSIFLDQDSDFSSPDYIYYTSPATNTSKVVDFALDGNTIYYWRVVAYDIFLNARGSTNNFTYITDTIAPNVTLNTPLNNTYTANSLVSFNFTPAEFNTLDTCVLYGNFTGTWSANTTDNSPVNNSFNIINSTLSEGVYIWNVLCNDSSGNSEFSSANYTLIVDLTGPNVSLIAPPNNTFENTTNNVVYTISAIDDLANVSSCELLVNGVAQQSNNSVIDGVAFNLTDFSFNGVYNWSARCTDINGNIGTSVVYNISILVVDNDPPLITLNYPDPDAFLSDFNITFNYTPEDATGIYNCSIYLDGTLNQTCGLNPTNAKAETGTIDLTGLTNTANLDNEYNVSKAFIIRNYATLTTDSNQEPDGGTATIEWSSCNGDLCDQLTATRIASDAEDAIASYSILQADNIRVWNFSISWSGGQNTATFDPDPDLPSNFNNKCFANIHRTTRINSATNSDFSEAEVRSNIFSASNVSFGRDGEDGGSPAAGVSVGEVVCFLDDTTVEEVFFSMSEAEPTTDNVPISSIDTSLSWAMHNHRQPDDGVGQNSVINEITNSTNLQLSYVETGQSAAGDQPQVTAYIIQHEEGSGVSTRVVQINPTSGDQDITSSVVPPIADLNNTLLMCYNTMAAGGGTAHTRDYWAHEFVNESSIRSVNYRTRGASQATIINCWIIEWPSTTRYNQEEQNACYVENLEINSFNISNIPEGVHDWNISCTDPSLNAAFSSTRQFTIDVTDPTVTLNTPLNDTFVSATLFLNYTPVDVSLDTCILYANFSGSWTSISSDSNPISGIPNNFTRTESDGKYAWNVLCNDSAGRQSFADANFTLKIDSTAPMYSNNLTDPTSPATYALGQQYNFNITWTDNFAVDTVILESNFTGSLVNQTLTSSGSIYNFTTYNLSAGSYVYKWYANDTVSNRNQTIQYTYIVNKASSEVNLLLNGTSSNISIDEDQYLNMSSVLVTPTTGFVELFLNASFVTNGSSPISNLTFFSEPGLYNITAIYPETQNYTSDIETWFLTVNDTTNATVTLISPQNNTLVGTNDVNFLYNVSDSSDIINCSLYVNGTLTQTNSSITRFTTQSFTENLANGNYNWSVQCYDSFNNLGTSFTYNFTVLFSDIILINVTTDNSTYEKGDPANITIITKDEFGNPMITNTTTDIIYSHGENTSIPWWNTSWKRRKPIFLSNSQAENRTDIPIILNVTGLTGNITDCDELRIAKFSQNVNTEIDSGIKNGDDTNWCQIIFLANVSASASNENDYFVYYNNTGVGPGSYLTDPSNNNQTIINIDFEDVNEINNWAEDSNGPASPAGLIELVNSSHPFSNSPPFTTHSGTWVLAFTNLTDPNLAWGNRTSLINLTGYTNVNVSMWKAEESTEGTDQFQAYYWDGGSWVQLWSDIDGVGNGAMSAWQQFVNTIPDSADREDFYLQIRWETSIADPGEHMFIDDIRVYGTFNNTATGITTSIGQEKLHISRVTGETDANGEIDFLFDTLNETIGNYSVVTFASAGNFSDYNFTTFQIIPDMTPPNISILLPIDQHFQGVGDINFTYQVYDINLDSCTLYFGTGGAFDANETNSTPLNDYQNNTFQNIYLGIGSYTWNVLCNDTFGNEGFAPANFTLNITGPDLIITNGNITFSNTPQVEGVNTTIFANISNIGLSHANESFIVQFFYGEAGTGTQINGNLTVINLSIGESVLLNVTYVLNIGENNFSVLIDPPNVINESDESNNNATRNITTSLYQILYGNVSAGLKLLDSNLTPVIEFGNVTDEQGHIFVTDSDSSFSFTELVAITRNEFGSPVLGDFDNVDTNLNSTNFSDSIKQVWGDGTDTPLNTETFALISGNIDNVPIINSTNSSYFVTGILWDSDDDTGNNRYDITDREDLVFITRINVSGIGAYGNYDYEIKVPALLRSYDGAQDTLDFFIELV